MTVALYGPMTIFPSVGVWMRYGPRSMPYVPDSARDPAYVSGGTITPACPRYGITLGSVQAGKCLLGSNTLVSFQVLGEQMARIRIRSQHDLVRLNHPLVPTVYAPSPPVALQPSNWRPGEEFTAAGLGRQSQVHQRGQPTVRVPAP